MDSWCQKTCNLDTELIFFKFGFVCVIVADWFLV